jgi:hypothetical protein
MRVNLKSLEIIREYRIIIIINNKVNNNKIKYKISKKVRVIILKIIILTKILLKKLNILIKKVIIKSLN